MTKQQIIDFLEKEKIDDYDCFIACACCTAYTNVDLCYRNNFDAFCNVVEECWLDTDNLSITVIGDYVADFINENNGRFPEVVEDLGIEDLYPMY